VCGRSFPGLLVHATLKGAESRADTGEVVMVMSSTARRFGGYPLADWESLEPREGSRIELVNGRFRVNAARQCPISASPTAFAG
jgi:hypothetical protein